MWSRHAIIALMHTAGACSSNRTVSAATLDLLCLSDTAWHAIGKRKSEDLQCNHRAVSTTSLLLSLLAQTVVCSPPYIAHCAHTLS